MLKTRIMTAGILLPLLVWLLLYATPFEFLEATFVIIIVGSFEWARLAGFTHFAAKFLYFYIVCLLLIFAFFISSTLIFAFSLVWWLTALILIIKYPAWKPWSTRLIRGIMGAFVLIPFIIGLNHLRSWPQGNIVIILLLALIFIADTAAYFAGKRFGKTKLAPWVSPGKTVEGVIGALIVSFFYLSILMLFTDNLIFYKKVLFVLIGLITVLFSIVGDLFESMLKRIVGVKDSSMLLPGHGGLLDRIDSLTAAVPIFIIGMELLNKL